MANIVSPASAIRGQRHIAAETTSQLVPDVLNRIIRWNPSRAPFITLMKMLRDSRTTNNRKYELWEQKPPARFVTVVSDNGTNQVTVSVADSKHIKDGQLLYNLTTQEIFRVDISGVNTSTGVLTCTSNRGWGGTATVTASAGQQLMLCGTAFADGTIDGTAIQYLQDNSYNYTGIHKSSVEASRRASVQKRYGGWTINDDRMEVGFQHKEEIERNLLFMRRHLTTDSNGKEITSTQGLVHYLSTNGAAFPTPPTKRALTEALEPIFRFGDGAVDENGGGAKHALCSPMWLTHIDEEFGEQLSREVIDIGTSEDKRANRTVGWHVTSIVTTHGLVHLHRMQDWAFFDELKGRMLVIDPNHLRLCYLEGGQTKLLKNREQPDADGSKDTYLTDVGLDLEVEAAHGDFRTTF